MKVLAATFVLLVSVSCSSPPPPTFCGYGILARPDQEQVSLIKSEKFKEAAAIDLDPLAHAFVKTLREMKAEGADPKRIVAVANYFFDHYPFSIKDIEISERDFTAIADVHYEAIARILPALPSCADLRRATTFAAKTEVIRSWEGPHADGGRCGRDLVEFLEKARQRGPAWAAELPRGDRDPSPRRAAKDLLEACRSSIEDQPEYVLVVFKIAALQSLVEGASCETWDIGGGRWERIVNCRLAWLIALTWHPLHYPNYRAVAEIAELWEKETEPRLRDLGKAFGSWKAVTSNFATEWAPDPVTYEPLLDEFDGLAKGTPFPDFVRFSLLAAWRHLGQLEKVERTTLEWWGDFADPFFPTLLLSFLAEDVREGSEVAKTGSEWAMRLAKEVLRRDPDGELAPRAWLTMARLHAQAGRHREKVECILAALKKPTSKSPFEHKFLIDARSDAGSMLAKHYEGVGDWTRALEAWRSWEPYAYCGEGWAGIEAGLHGGLGRCLDRTGKPEEAAPHLWEFVSSAYCTETESAKRLKEIHESLGTTLELADKVRIALKKEFDNEGLKWLAEALGVSGK